MSAETYCQHHDKKGLIYWRANAAENFIINSLFKYLHANFAILLETTELKVDNSELQKVFFKGRLAEENPRDAFGWLDKKVVISFLD